MLTGDMLRRSAERFPDKPAILWNRTSLSYRSLDEEANQLANALLKHNVKKGDWVIVPVGGNEDIFSDSDGYESLQIVEVVAVTDNVSDHMPQDYEVKHIVGKVNGKVYTKLYEAKNQQRRK